MLSLQRFVTGISLSVIIKMLLYLGFSNWVACGLQLASFYDCYSLYLQTGEIKSAMLLNVAFGALNRLLYSQYLTSPITTTHLIVVVQVSDALQYIGGTFFGYHKLGMISPNKSYEGYAISLIILLFYPFLSYRQIMVYWLAGVCGGLLNSSLKRYLGVKDFSKLLGEHGGWTDRMDSIYPTILMARILQA